VEILLLSLVGVVLGVPLSMQLTMLFNKQFEAVMSGPSVVFIPDIIIARSLLIVGVSLLTMFLVIWLTLKRNVAEKLRQVFEAM